jgi:hypothetical protein
MSTITILAAVMTTTKAGMHAALLQTRLS